MREKGLCLHSDYAYFRSLAAFCSRASRFLRRPEGIGEYGIGPLVSHTVFIFKRQAGNAKGDIDHGRPGGAVDVLDPCLRAVPGHPLQHQRLYYLCAFSDGHGAPLVGLPA